MTENLDASLSRKTRIDSIATDFEQQWRLGDRVIIEDVLAANGDVPCGELLSELLLLEIELRQEAGESVFQSDYRFRFPRDSAVLDAVFTEARIPERLVDTIVLSGGDTKPADGCAGRDGNSRDSHAPVEDFTLAIEPLVPPTIKHPPRVIGDFEVIELIGEGGMGVVYKARQKSLNRIVALKVIRTGINANVEELRRFQTEAEAAAKLNHPNILPVYEFGKHGDSTLYIAMPFIQGKTLREKLGSGTMNPRAAATMMLKLAKALAHAHERRILHRDLKPSNILFDENQNPLIMDFGLACDLSSDEHLTRTSQILGTPQFMPPEQAGQQNGRTDFRSDVYSLGAVLYYTLRGVPPFTGSSANEVIQKVLHDDPVSPRADDKSIPRDLETICLKSLRKEQDQRYQTANELAADLELFLEGKPIVARPLPVLERAVRWCRRRPWQAAIIGLLIAFALTATASAGVMTQLRKEERDARLLAEEAKRDAQDATLMATEHQVRAQLSARDLTEVSFGAMADGTTQVWSAKSVDNAYIEHERAYSLPKVLNSSAGDWGYFDFRPSPSGKLLAVCDQAGAVQILDASTGREVHKLADEVSHPENKGALHLAIFESALPIITQLERPAFTYSLDWVNETTVVAVDDRKRLLKHSLAKPNEPAADRAVAAAAPDVLCELPEIGHLVRVRSSDGAMLVCLESGALNLFAADGTNLATNAETASRPMSCQYHTELKCWITAFENGDVVVLDDAAGSNRAGTRVGDTSNNELKLVTRLATGSTVHCVAMSKHQNRWVADIACAHRAIVRYEWNDEGRSFAEIATFDIPSRMHDHYFTAVVASRDQSRLFARDNKGHIIAWETINEEFLGMFLATQPSNPWLAGMKATLRWPPILDRNPSFVDLTPEGRLRAVDAMGVIMEFATDVPAKEPTWKTLNVKLGADPSLAAVHRSPNEFWALDVAGTLSKIDAAKGTVEQAVANAHPGPVPSLAAMNDGRLVTVSGDRTIRVWTTSNGQPREVRRIEHERNLISLAVDEANLRIAAMDEQAVVSLWNTETGRKVASAQMADFAVQDDANSPLNKCNAEPAANGITSLAERPYTGKLAFNQTGEYLAAFGAGQQFDILECNGGLKAVTVGGQHEARAQGGTVLCWSGTNPWRLIEGDEYGTAAAWVAGKEPATHTGRITGSVAFGGYPADSEQTPDNGRMCLLMRDGRLLFITAEHFVPTILVDTGVRGAHSLTVGNTGQTILVSGRDGTLRSAVFADFSLPEETTLKPLTGTRHALLSLKDKRFPKPSSLFTPHMNSVGEGTATMVVAEDARGTDGELCLIRRRDNVWQLDPVQIPNSPGTDAPQVFPESAGLVFSKERRPIVALRQVLSSGGYDGRVLMAREQADGSWVTEVVLNNGNEGHACFPIVDTDGEVNSLLHFDWECLQLRYSRRGPSTEQGWPTETLAKGRGFRMAGFQNSDGTVRVCMRSIRGAGDYAPDRYLIMKPGEPPQWEYAPGLILKSLSDGTPIVCNMHVNEAACGSVYRRKGNDWEHWTTLPGTFSAQRILSQICIATDDSIWLADYRQVARRLYAWHFKDQAWTCYEIDAELPDLINLVSCWIEEGNRLAIVLTGSSTSEPGTVDVIETFLPMAEKLP